MSRDDEVAIFERDNEWVVMFIKGDYEHKRYRKYFELIQNAVRYACELNRKKGYTEYGVRIYDKEYQDCIF